MDGWVDKIFTEIIIFKQTSRRIDKEHSLALNLLVYTAPVLVSLERLKIYNKFTLYD